MAAEDRGNRANERICKFWWMEEWMFRDVKRCSKMNEHLHLAAQLQNDVERESLRKEEWVWVEVEEGAEDGGVGPTRAAASALGNFNWNWNWKGDKIQLFVSEIIFAWKNGSQGHHFGKILNSKFLKGLRHSALCNETKSSSQNSSSSYNSRNNHRIAERTNVSRHPHFAVQWYNSIRVGL